MKILLALIALAATTGHALAQSRSFYDASARSIAAVDTTSQTCQRALSSANSPEVSVRITDTATMASDKHRV